MKILGIMMMTLAIIFAIIELVMKGIIGNIILFQYLIGLGMFEVSTHS